MSYDFSHFGSRVFNDRVMRDKLSKGTYLSLRRSIDEGHPLEPAVAEVVASAMKDWAVEQGATHFTHWFQPMTTFTAGKHDSFIAPTKEGLGILEFSGKELIVGEPDASSFPSGGLRNTFEARGYTSWDCTSPAFVREGTLYIPTAFYAYTGEALDTKTPLLRSNEAVNKQALRVLRAFGNTQATRVSPTVGAEQEYFLIDREKYEQRLDLKLCGRTLFGARPAKGQEMEDHYCGRIRLRVRQFMRDLDEALWELGVPCKTEHNEAAPAQHELAPVFEAVNVACDHNQLTMEVIREVAKKNGLACLLHEKPFQGVNGSGKHNNWSLSTNDGQNLLDPGKTPYENMQFLVFLSAVISAVDDYADLLRMSAANAGNDFRLGGHEAPPGIISIYLGEQLTDVLEHIAHGDVVDQTPSGILETGVATLPKLPRDGSDRNRTSPFAFTGNKFEFRMVGSSASVAISSYVLNTIVADALCKIADRLERCTDFDAEIQKIVQETVRDHGRIIFNGNNYTDEWVEEAARRGLPNLHNTVDAITAMIAPKNIAVMERHHVMSSAECHSRYEIMLENYCKILNIEAATMCEMSRRQILPAAIRFTGGLAESFSSLKAAGIENRSVRDLAQLLSDDISEADRLTGELERALERCAESADLLENARYHRDCIRRLMEKLREVADRMEKFVAASEWPIPTYADLLYRV
ncbi:MAG TPA: glutamine synthetase III [Candidatus Merdivicinus faecavium]|nr:glutamine synthetase III [Candidatus Merdivicinus faecavium]